MGKSVGTSTISNISNTSTRSPSAKSIITRNATTLAVRTATGAVSVSSTTGLTDSVTIREMKKKLKNKYFLSKSVNAERNQYIFFPPQKFYALEIKVTPQKKKKKRPPKKKKKKKKKK